MEALNPFFLRKGRGIAIETAAGDLEAEQRQPVLEPVERDEVAGPRHRLLAAEVALDAEQAEGIEAGDDELAFGANDAMNLAQQLMRLVGEFQHVRQDDQIDAVLGERKPVRIGQDLCRLFQVHRHARRDARSAQERIFRHADLQRMVAEDIGERPVEIRLFALEQIASQRGREPRRQRPG